MTAATGGNPSNADKVTVFRKYANRRLYDTTRAKCVTLADVAARVRAGENIRIVEAKSGNNVTRQVLAQILCESEQAAGKLFDEEVLTRLIRIADTPEGTRVAEAFSRALDRLSVRRHRDAAAPLPHAAAMLRPKGLSEVRAVAARIDALEARLHSLMDGAEAATARRGARPHRGD